MVLEEAEKDQVYKDEAVKEFAEHVINQRLEDRETVAQAEWHDKVFVVLTWCDESSLPFVTLPYVHQAF